jgi:hypothetical protein
MEGDERDANRREESGGSHADGGSTHSGATGPTESSSTAGATAEADAATSLQSQLDVLTLLVAVVGLGLLVGGVAETFAALFSLGVTFLVLYRLHRRDIES